MSLRVTLGFTQSVRNGKRLAKVQVIRTNLRTDANTQPEHDRTSDSSGLTGDIRHCTQLSGTSLSSTDAHLVVRVLRRQQDGNVRADEAAASGKQDGTWNVVILKDNLARGQDPRKAVLLLVEVMLHHGD